jgi:hypothetical protein
MARGWCIGVRAGDYGATVVFWRVPARGLSVAAPSSILSIIQLHLQKNVLWEIALTSVAVLNNGPSSMESYQQKFSILTIFAKIVGNR